VKIVFAKQDPQTVLDNITSSLGGPNLLSMISLDLGKNNRLEVTIKKAGTSSLSFDFHENSKEITWHLTGQKIAFAHLPFKATIFERLKAAVHHEGGKVIDEE
jgi:hypothetical protein